MKSNIPKTPSDLGPAGKRLFAAVADQFVLEAHHVETLRLACQQLDRAHEARLLLSKGELVAKDRFGQLKQHPAIEIERQSSLAATRLLRELGLDTAAAEATIRSYSRRGA